MEEKMAAKRNEPEDDLISSINVTPLVDIFLVLLIIFMVTANIFMQQEKNLREIALTLPKAHSGAPPEPKDVPLNLILDQAGALYLNGEPTTLEKIGAYIDRRATEAGGRIPDAVLSADKDLAYGKVTRVIDFVKLRGVGNVALNVEEQSIPGIEP